MLKKKKQQKAENSIQHVLRDVAVNYIPVLSKTGKNR
jgi:hypothetical protein